MRTKLVSILLGGSVFAGASTAAFATPATDFVGPAGWTRTDVPTPNPARSISTWQLGGDTSTSLTFITDAATSFEDALAAMNKNFSDNGIRLAVNKDEPCYGATAHVVEFTSGPDGARTIFNRLVVPLASGVATITYTRAEGNAFEGDVRKAEQAFCALTPAVPPERGTAAKVAPSPSPSAARK